jgi:hypothetical protein
MLHGYELSFETWQKYVWNDGILTAVDKTEEVDVRLGSEYDWEENGLIFRI